MTKPPKHYQFDLVPNEDGKGPKRSPSEERRLAKAAEFRAKALLKKKGLLNEDPGAIEPTAEETERAAEIAKKVNPVLISQASAHYEEITSVRIDHPDGRVEHRTKEIRAATHRLDVSLESLRAMLDRVIDVVGEGGKRIYGVAIKVASWFASRVPYDPGNLDDGTPDQPYEGKRDETGS